MNFDCSEKHECRVWSVIGTALVWIALWFLVDVCFQKLQEKYQIIAYVIVLGAGVKILYQISKKGYWD